MVNEKEKKALQACWDKSTSSGEDIPEGDYEFLIIEAIAEITKKGSPMIRQKLKVVGGNEDYVGKETEVRDNLESEQNMGFFKKKLARLRITIPKDVDTLMGDGEGSVAADLVGRKFSGAVRYKNDFMNIYVNRLLGVEQGEAEAPAPAAKATKEKAAPAEETEAEETTEEAAFTVGDRVNFTSKADGDLEGELLELCEGDDEGKARVKVESTGKTYKILAANMTKVEAEATETEETEETTEEATDKSEWPAPGDVEKMRLPQIKDLLAEHGIEAGDVKEPRKLATGIAGFLSDKTYVPHLTEIGPLCEALEVKVPKGAKPADAAKKIKEAVLAKFA